jgi:phosphatidylinositol-3-phosphatase
MCPRDLDILSIASINPRNPRLTAVSYSSQEISKRRSAISNRLRTLIFRTIAVPLAMAVSIFSIELAHGDNSFSLPRPDHIVLVIEENHAYSQIINSPDAPYINRLAAQGALFTQSFGITHPSQPNYLALFSGSTQGITDNSCPHTFTTPNLGQALQAAGLTFVGYSEDSPSIGSIICSEGHYARKHNPWVNWQDSAANGLPTTTNLPMTNFPTEYNTLSTVSIVVPNQMNDMHSGKDSEMIRAGDRWLRDRLDAYVQWAQQHNSLLIVTWDEDNGKENNRIATLFIGPMVQAGHYGQQITHYNVLRTIGDLYGLSHSGASAVVTPIAHIWKSAPRP